MIGRLIIKLDNKVYSVLVNSYAVEHFSSREPDKVKLYFVDNPIIRSFYWNYMLPKNFLKKELRIVDFLGKPYILTFITIEEPIDKGSSDFMLTLIPLNEPPKLPPCRFEPIRRITSPQEFPWL
jgi:hypothetical protein|uniref:Uncharacterized protein n=1 Tax=Siphoviridae sp. ctuBK6 TaxID=2827963 RepID=A0A8S5TH87_9CAUD|nr:MAG TPA: hypothetical protein [Siphoviridae sp. ctuBK6]